MASLQQLASLSPRVHEMVSSNDWPGWWLSTLRTASGSQMQANWVFVSLSSNAIDFVAKSLLNDHYRHQFEGEVLTGPPT